MFIKKSTPPLFSAILCNFLFFGLSSCSFSESDSYEYSILPQGKDTAITSDFMQINIKNSIVLNIKTFNKLPIRELSGIAWDNDEKLLYAISDSGYLYHLKLQFSGNPSQQKLDSMKVVFATELKDSNGKALKGKYSDSEGLSLANGNNKKMGDSKLIISFENKPRIANYTPQGELLSKVRIPKKLRKRKTYRSKNKALESVTYHPKYGVLTAAEYPIKKDSIGYQTLYATSKNAKIKKWHFKAAKASNSAITGLETLQDGTVLVLERAYKNPLIPIVINLRRLHLNDCNAKQECKIENIARFDGADGWLLDNFEGLAHLQGNEYLMVSDDNGNPFQKTIFLHFSIH